MRHVAAPLTGFESVSALEAMQKATDPNYFGRPTRRYPIRYLRYWFMRHLLDGLHQRLRRPLRVLEVGIGEGKMLAFMEGPKIGPDRYALPPQIERWDALSAGVNPVTIERYSYSSLQDLDIETDFQLAHGDYDAMILLHVLEHLAAPEATMRRLLASLRPGGLMMGGSPTMPDLFVPFVERQLRRKYADRMDDLYAHKHLSVISPGRVRRFARAQGLGLDLMAGTFFMRASASPLEDHPWWIRANLAWGALFPALGGEVYFALRKPERA